jgi:F0F1-type ATP synthase membrane subunit c/vacuolar-type H+-ATPase subunit K
MPVGITAALIAAGLASGAGAVAQGVGQARAAKKLFTEADEEELAELRRRERTGEALTEAQRARLESRARIGQAAAARQLEAAALQQAAASARGPVSGRDVFLRQQAEQAAVRGMRQEQNLAIQSAEQAAEQANAARIQALREQQRQADIARIQGISTAAQGVAAAAADVAGAQAAQMQQLQLIEAQLGALEDADLLRQYLTTGDRSFGLIPE